VSDFDRRCRFCDRILVCRTTDAWAADCRCGGALCQNPGCPDPTCYGWQLLVVYGTAGEATDFNRLLRRYWVVDDPDEQDDAIEVRGNVVAVTTRLIDSHLSSINVATMRTIPQRVELRRVDGG
jgi:hypothetical protein